jgi:hypothetical protein
MSKKQGFNLEYGEPVAERGRARQSCAKRATRAAAIGWWSTRENHYASIYRYKNKSLK